MSLCKLTIKEYFPIAPLLTIQIIYLLHSCVLHYWNNTSRSSWCKIISLRVFTNFSSFFYRISVRALSLPFLFLYRFFSSLSSFPLNLCPYQHICFFHWFSCTKSGRTISFGIPLSKPKNRGTRVQVCVVFVVIVV